MSQPPPSPARGVKRKELSSEDAQLLSSLSATSMKPATAPASGVRLHVLKKSKKVVVASVAVKPSPGHTQSLVTVGTTGVMSGPTVVPAASSREILGSGLTVITEPAPSQPPAGAARTREEARVDDDDDSDYSPSDDARPSMAGKIQHRCKECRKTFKTLAEIEAHMKSAHQSSLRRYTCDVCSKSFTVESSLRTHKRLHDPNCDDFVCNVCGEKCTQPSALRRHMRQHTGEKPFQCKQCSRTFAESSHLYVHVRTHTGDKPYACPKCPARFAQANNVTQHMVVHTAQKPFHCDRCKCKPPIGFTRKSSLKKHMINCHGDKNWTGENVKPSTVLRRAEFMSIAEDGAEAHAQKSETKKRSKGSDPVARPNPALSSTVVAVSSSPAAVGTASGAAASGATPGATSGSVAAGPLLDASGVSALAPAAVSTTVGAPSTSDSSPVGVTVARANVVRAQQATSANAPVSMPPAEHERVLVPQGPQQTTSPNQST